MLLNLSSATRIGLNVLALLGASVALYLGQSIFIPVTISALLAVILWPAASWLHRKLKFPWFLACLTVILGLIVVNVGVFVGFALAVPSIMQELPNPRDPQELKEIYKKARESLEPVAPKSIDRVLPKDEESSNVYNYTRQLLDGRYVTDQLITLSKIAGAWLMQSVIILFILLFLLLEGQFLADRIKAIFGRNTVTQSAVTRALAGMAEAIRSYLVWRTLVNIGLGLFLGLVYSLLELRQPWTWALLTAVLCYVPYIGTIIAGIPPILDALIHVSPFTAAVILVFYTIVVTVEGYLIVPLVMGRSMDLNATTVMIACLFWDLVWGFPGLFLAMPIMAGIRAVCLHTPGFRAWAYLMSTERSLKEWQEEDHASTPSIKLPEPDLDATVVLEDGEPINGTPAAQPNPRIV
ncbi:MAG TPA: AI-2E family transporter [Gemmataceae bacterium]|jgi:predicted PurR-regulated permease PerM|nr:AI-2E family transporter [Gemmataceae bacterium]